jgi:predicted anti-sigma-YlaC factor YlaD
MSEDVHARAGHLIAQERVEGIAPEDRQWLDKHLQECESCAAQEQLTEEAVRTLRSVAVPLPRTLASRAQMRVRLRAQELREREPRSRMIWVVCGLSWALGIASAPYVWRVFAWMGEHTGAPKLVWELGFGLWWTIPALIAAVVLLLENARKTDEGDWSHEQR